MQVRIVMHKTYELLCRLPARTASERIEALLSKEGVKYKTADLSVASTRTPIAVIGIEPKLYSRSNWVGVNPFTFVSGVEVQCEQRDNELTKVTLRVNRLRAFLWVAFWIACSALAARAMPEPGGAVWVVAVACAAWFGIVSFLGGHLVKKEISDRLKEHP
jgi:hypothetical protein